MEFKNATLIIKLTIRLAVLQERLERSKQTEEEDSQEEREDAGQSSAKTRNKKKPLVAACAQYH